MVYYPAHNWLSRVRFSAHQPQRIEMKELLGRLFNVTITEYEIDNKNITYRYTKNCTSGYSRISKKETFDTLEKIEDMEIFLKCQ